MPGIGALNKGGAATVTSVSCASAGNCAAGGQYTDRLRHRQAFVARETNGTWHAAIEIPGTGALNKGGNADVTSVSCASAGNCLVGGFYRDRFRFKQAFVASQRNGTWHKAIEVPGTAALNKRGDAWVHSLSCASAGNCVAGGDYRDGLRHRQAFVASERNGTWHKAIEVPGTATLNKGGSAEVDSVSCPSAGNCLVGGRYDAGGTQAFVASERRGTWHKAIKVPGTGALNTGGAAAVDSVSCASAGNCTVGGSFTDSDRQGQPFVASQTNGTWHAAIHLPGVNAIDGGVVQSLSCGSAGNCLAGGFYLDGAQQDHAFVASQTNGTWQGAIEVPGTVTLDKGGIYGPAAETTSVSCASAGNCTAVGIYIDGQGHNQAFVASQTNGTWQAAIELPGTATLDTGGSAAVNSVSCAPAGTCAAGGSYQASHGHYQAFVASQA